MFEMLLLDRRNIGLTQRATPSPGCVCVCVEPDSLDSLPVTAASRARLLCDCGFKVCARWEQASIFSLQLSSGLQNKPPPPSTYTPVNISIARSSAGHNNHTD